MDHVLGEVHSVTLFSLQDEVTEEQWQNAVAELEEMWASIPEVKSWIIGRNRLNHAQSCGFSHLLMLEFADEQAWKTYMVNPVHHEVARRTLVPMYTQRAAGVLRDEQHERSVTMGGHDN